jgi:uncharacterized membrane protein YcgQ (UPF0703/DUF1980 family)
MTTSLSKYASSLILLEWGAIMLYFNLSGRVSAFLHPHFRPLLWVVGIMLVLTAIIIAFAQGSGCRDDNETESIHDHDHNCGANHIEHAHRGNTTNGRLTTTGVVSFLVLCLPIALAAMISPDSFGETFLRNRGIVQTVQQPDKTSLTAAQSSTALGNNPGTERDNFVSDQNSPQTLNDEQFDATSVGLASAEQTLPTSEKNSTTATSEQDQEYENPALRPDKEGNIHAEVIDLLYACEDPLMRKDFDGKQVAMIRQVAHRKKARHERGPFQLVRFVMVCCAADVQPIAVMVQYPKSSPDFESLAWVKVIGKVRFQNVGDHVEPAVYASKVISIPQPADQYLY